MSKILVRVFSKNTKDLEIVEDFYIDKIDYEFYKKRFPKFIKVLWSEKNERS